ncbi:uncharacterized protein [Rutidosis leptorrhynchoides]|uniref:uncharacterized protein n=1 Tax=Rutidosis leptorrhynchoides TaxID=125765 RepID=UPI003A99FE59
MKEDILALFNRFWELDEISNGCNSSFIALIPKKNDPQSFGDYRPISLIGCLYKILSKVLTKRLQSVISSVIGFEQSAYIKNRYILDGILIANEALHDLKATKHKGFLFKVDFEKAFDRLSNSETNAMVEWLGCASGTLPITYLGLPIGSSMKKLKDWESVFEKLEKRLADWKAKSLSYDGRLTLIKSVLSRIPLNFFSLYKAPICVINKLESLRRRFFWEGRVTSQKCLGLNGTFVCFLENMVGLISGHLQLKIKLY